MPRRQFIIAFYKAYQEYTDVQGTTTHLPLSTVLNPSGDNLNSSLDGQNPDRITIPEDYLILTGHPTEQIKGDSVLSTAAWIVNIYRKNRDDDGRIIVYSVVANQDDVYTDYYGHRLYQDNVDTSPVKIANQSGAKTFNSIYVPPVERLSVSTSVKARAISEDTAEIDVRLSLVLSAQYPGYWFEPWTFQYDVIPVDYVNYAEFEQYHILQLRERDS